MWNHGNTPTSRSRSVLDYYEALLEEVAWLKIEQSWTVLLYDPGALVDAYKLVDLLTPDVAHEDRDGHISEFVDFGVGYVSHDIRPESAVFFEVGYYTARVDVIRALSSLGRVYNVRTDIDARNRLTYAAHGQVVCQLDLTAKTIPAAEYESLAPESAVFRHTANNLAAAMAVVELRSDFRLTQEWLEAVHRGWLFPLV